MAIDRLDAAIIELMTTEPRIGVYELSRRLGVARGTVQARLDRMSSAGIIQSFAPTIDVDELGYPVSAFIIAEIAQGERTSSVIGHLSAIPEVLEVQTVTGQGDLIIRVVAESNSDLQRVIDEVVSHQHVTKTSTTIALGREIAYRTLPLVLRRGNESSASARLRVPGNS